MGLITEPGTAEPGAAGRTSRPAWLPAALVLTGAGWGSNQITPILLLYQKKLALTTGGAEALFGVYALGLIPGLLAAGPLSDRRGRRLVAIPAAVLSLLASLALVAGSHDTALLYVGRLLAGVSSGAAFGAGTAWVRELSRSPHGAASDHHAARRAAVAMTMGFALGPLAAGILGQWAPQPMMVAYLPHLVLMVGVLWSLRHIPETVVPKPVAPRALVRAAPRPGNFNRPRFLAVVAPMAPWVFAAPSVAFALLPSVVGANRATDGIGLDAGVTALCALSGVLVQPAARRLDTRAGSTRAVTVGLSVAAAGMLLGGLAAHTGYLWLLWPCAIVLGAAFGICLVAGLTEVQRLAHPEELARLTAIFYVLTYLGFAVPSVLVLASQVASYSTLLLILAGLAVVTVLGIRTGEI